MITDDDGNMTRWDATACLRGTAAATMHAIMV